MGKAPNGKPNGISLNVYHSDGSVYDEGWYTWSEVDHRKTIDESVTTAELPHLNRHHRRSCPEPGRRRVIFNPKVLGIGRQAL